MWLDNNYLYVAVTGRCAYIIRVTLPQGSAPFSSATSSLIDPAPSNQEYLSSAARDPVSNILYMAIQSYDRRTQPRISSINLITMMSTNAPVVSVDTQGQAKTIIVFGMDGNERNLFALAAGSTEAYRYIADQNGVSLNLVLQTFHLVSMILDRLFLLGNTSILQHILLMLFLLECTRMQAFVPAFAVPTDSAILASAIVNPRGRSFTPLMEL